MNLGCHQKTQPPKNKKPKINGLYLFVFLSIFHCKSPDLEYFEALLFKNIDKIKREKIKNLKSQEILKKTRKPSKNPI